MQKAETNAHGNATATVSRGSGKAIDDVRITPSVNGGYSVQASYRQTEKKRKGGGVMDAPTGWMRPETFTYESFDALVKGLKHCFGVK